MIKNGVIHLTTGLTPDEYGVWTDDVTRSLSYPESGNQDCSLLEDGSFWFRHRNDCILSVMRRHSPCGTILDVGGGNGYVARRMLDEGFDCSLLEPGPVGARIAKTRRQIPEVLCTQLEDAGFPDGSLSAIGCFDVIEHIEDDAAFLALVTRLLEDEGLLYATVPAHGWLWSSSDIVAGHHRRYSRRQVARLLGDQMRLVYFTYLFGALTLPIFAFRTIPTAVGLSRDRNVLSVEVEHGVSGGAGTGILSRLLQWELDAVSQGKTRPIGSSCLFVAQKPG